MEDLFIVGIAYWKQGNKISFRKENIPKRPLPS